MKNHHYLLLSAAALVVAAACSRASSLAGDYECGVTSVTSGNDTSRFNAKSDSVTIKLSDSNWTIRGITLSDANNELISLANWSNYKNNDLRLFENDTCYVQRLDGNTLFIKMKENTTNLARTIDIWLFVKHCSPPPKIKVVQAAE